MSTFSVDRRWLLGESRRIGSIVLAGFLVAHLIGELISAFGIGLLYGLQGTLVAVLQFTTLLTALLYVVTVGVDGPPRPRVRGDE